MSNYDVESTGVLNLLVGRDDGQVEMYGYSDAGEPILRFSQVYSFSVFLRCFVTILNLNLVFVVVVMDIPCAHNIF